MGGDLSLSLDDVAGGKEVVILSGCIEQGRERLGMGEWGWKRVAGGGRGEGSGGEGAIGVLD